MARAKAATRHKLGPTAIVRKGAYVHIADPFTGRTVRIPARSLPQVSELLQQLGKGNAVQVIRKDRQLSTQQAADILNVSRPFVVKLIDEGNIRAERAGRHRRLLLKDVLALKERMKTQQLEGLRQLAAEAQELGLGY